MDKIKDVAFDDNGKLKGTLECDTAQDVKIEEKRYCKKM